MLSATSARWARRELTCAIARPIQKSLTEMNELLERVGNLSEKYSSKWIDWLPDFSLLVALKWIMLVLILGTAALAGWYGAAAIRGLFL